MYLIACLESPKRRRALKKLKGRRISELQPTNRTLQLLAKLQTDANHKVTSAAASCLGRASRSKSFRTKVKKRTRLIVHDTKWKKMPAKIKLDNVLQALVHYTDLLKNSDTQVQLEACLALKCLKVSPKCWQNCFQFYVRYSSDQTKDCERWDCHHAEIQTVWFTASEMWSHIQELRGKTFNWNHAQNDVTWTHIILSAGVRDPAERSPLNPF